MIMYKSYIAILCSLTILLAACSKEKGPGALADNSVNFNVPAGKDTVQTPLSILKDDIVVVNFNAALSGSKASSDHWINLAVDTAKFSSYRKKYGDALLLPSNAYFFYKSQIRVPAGSSMSESAQLNILSPTKLLEYSTYVLPVVIKSVDGKVEGAASPKVLYYVFKTGKPVVISKAGWTIANVSSTLSAFAAARAIDNDPTGTYWASNITQQMPQWVTINFNRNITFSALSYSIPPIIRYPSQGGYPTSIQIETSMDGTTWVNNGVFAGDIANNTQTLNTKLTTARYLRFTSLASVKYAAIYSAIFISDISLVP
jgi:hypothetical protein